MDYAGVISTSSPNPAQHSLLCIVRVTGDIYEVNPLVPGTYVAAGILAAITSERHPNFPNLLPLSPLHPGCRCGGGLGFPSHEEALLQRRLYEKAVPNPSVRKSLRRPSSAQAHWKLFHFLSHVDYCLQCCYLLACTLFMLSSPHHCKESSGGPGIGSVYSPGVWQAGNEHALSKGWMLTPLTEVF